MTLVTSSGGQLLVEPLSGGPATDTEVRTHPVVVADEPLQRKAALLARGLDPSLPAMKAIGVREIADWLAGKTTREEMIERAVIATRQYAKRQRTWFRGRMADWSWIEA